MHTEQPPEKSWIRQRAAEVTARAQLGLETERAEVRARLDADQARPGEAAALAFVRKLQAAGVPHEAALVALEPWQGLTPGARAAVADVVYGVGEPVEEDDAGVALPQLDVDDLFADVPVVRGRVHEVAKAATCVPDMPALAALAFASVACAARVRGVIRNRDGTTWTVWPHLFVAPSVTSGSDKSRVRNLMGGKSIDAYQADLAARWGDRVEADKDERQQATQRRAAINQAIAYNKPHDANALAQIRARLARVPVVKPEFTWTGGSAQKYVSTVESVGFVGFVPAEGKGVLRSFYSNDSEVTEFLICSFSHEECANKTFASEERGDVRVFKELAAAGYLPLQPSVLQGRTAEDAQLFAKLADRGFLARMLVSQPRELHVREREALRALVRPAEFESPFNDFFRRLLSCEGGDDDHPLRPRTPKQMVFTPEAGDAVLAFQIETTDSAAPGGQYADLQNGSEWIRRQGDQAARIAIVLAVLRQGTIADGTVELCDAERAIRLVRDYYRPHTLTVAARTVHDPIGDDATRVLAWLRKLGQVTYRVLQTKLGAGWGKPKPGAPTTRLSEALEELQRRGEIAMPAEWTVRSPGGATLIRYVGRKAIRV